MSAVMLPVALAAVWCADSVVDAERKACRALVDAAASVVVLAPDKAMTTPLVPAPPASSPLSSCIVSRPRSASLTRAATLLAHAVVRVRPYVDHRRLRDVLHMWMTIVADTLGRPEAAECLTGAFLNLRAIRSEGAPPLPFRIIPPE